VFGVIYDQSSLPTTQDMIDDLAVLIDLYRLATARGGTDELASDHEITKQPPVDLSRLTLQEKRQLRYHRVIEGNPRHAPTAKQIHGYACQVCEFDFETEYGNLGHEYIEGDHLTPISELPLDQPVQLSPKDDFRVVCANCHRVIHREGAPGTFNDFLQLYVKQKALRQRAT
jgi:5-methylcytosine-specific restriction protein A